MVSLAYSLSYQGGSRSKRGPTLGLAYRVGLAALFVGLIGLDVTGVVRYSGLASTWGDMPVFGGLVKAMLIGGVIATIFGGQFTLRFLFSMGALGATMGFLALVASGGWTLPALLGYSARVGLPVVAALLAWNILQRPEATVRVLMALTFFAHAFWGFGWPSARSEQFDLLVAGTIGFEGVSAAVFFTVVGVCNLLAAAALFSPRFAIAGLLYMAVWGLVTALAYPLACSNLPDVQGGWLRWVAEFLTRVPHFLLPIVLLLEFGLARGGGRGLQRRLDISSL
jgi:hypothetical protein